jgi:TRAP-type mannitol/chloroaromatic compound transport system permease small subunit
MNLLGLSIITILGLIMAVTGFVGVVYYIARYRRIRRRFNEGEIQDPEVPPNTFATFWLINGFLHIGMLLLVLGGVGLMYYGQR